MRAPLLALIVATTGCAQPAHVAATEPDYGMTKAEEDARYREEEEDTCGKREALKLSPAKLPMGKAGKRYKAVIKATNSDTPLAGIASHGKLPPGLSAVFSGDAETLTLEGTPKKAGKYPLRVVASEEGTECGGRERKKTYQLEIAK